MTAILPSGVLDYTRDPMAAEFHDDSTQRTAVSRGPRGGGSESACLVVIHGEGLGRRLDIDEHPAIIGRSPQADLHIAHASMSRRHCQVWRDGNAFRIRDLGSTNRTRVNETVIEEAELRDGDHVVLGDIILKFIGRDSVEARYHEEIYQLATHDSLTGLMNRRHFSELLDAEGARGTRRRPRAVLAILDVDHFKTINDRHGHLEGDGVLRQLADILRRLVRVGDLLARIGGEEFAVLMPDTDVEQARAFAERVRQTIESSEFSPGGDARQVTVSIGLAAMAEDRLQRSELMRAADRALYAAKEGGRNRVVVAD